MAKKSKFGTGASKTIKYKGKDRANVTKDQVEEAGFPTTTEGLRKYMNAWNKSGKRPTANKVNISNRSGFKDLNKRKNTTDVSNRSGFKDLSSEKKQEIIPKRDQANLVPGKRSGDKTPRGGHPVHRAVSTKVKKNKYEVPTAAEQRAAFKEKFSGVIGAGKRGFAKLGEAKDQTAAAREAENIRFRKGVSEVSGKVKKFLTKKPDSRVAELKSEWFKLTGDERKKFGNQASYIKAKLGQNVAAKRSGGMVKKYKLGGRITKPIDGIALTGKTRARHR